MNEVTIELELKSVRLVCSTCGRFVVHGNPNQLELLLDLPTWNPDRPGCPVHGRSQDLAVDESACEIVLSQRSAA